MPTKPKTIDEYLAPLSDEQRAALEKLRKTIQTVAPQAEECISYGLAAFRLYGKPLVAIGATANHCAFYLLSNSTVAAHQDALTSYDTSTGTIRFAANKPLPAALVRKLVKARIVENGDEGTARRGRKAKSSSLKSQPESPLTIDVAAAIASLKRHASKSVRDGMIRFAIPSEKAFGVSVGDIRKIAKNLGRNHELAAALWEAEWYEARMLAAFVEDPYLVTPAQMDRWSRDFDSWAICDTVCFHLFDRTPHAWSKIAAWSRRSEEFAKRAAFAVLWGLTVHDKIADDDRFAQGLTFVERAATDPRNFVKKAVNMALRAIGKRNAALHCAAVAVAQRLAASVDSTARWVGKDAIRELTSSAVTKRLAARRGNDG